MSYVAHLYDFQPVDKPRSARRKTSIGTSAQQQIGIDHNAVIHNVSQTGILAECADPLNRGSRVEFDLPKIGRVPARIVWEGANLYGCEFVTPLTVEELDQVDHRKVVWADFSRSGSAMPVLAGEVIAPPSEVAIAPATASQQASEGYSSRRRLFLIIAATLACWTLFAVPVLLLTMLL